MLDMNQSEILVYDSLPGYIPISKLMEDLRSLSHTIPSLLYACGLMYGPECKYKGTPWNVFRTTSDRRQRGGIDCGIFACKFIEYLVTANSLETLVQSEVSHIRSQYATQLWHNEPYFE